MAKVTTSTVGRQTVVTVEALSGATGTGSTVTLTLDGSGRLSRPEWEGLTITQIKRDHRLYVGGKEVLTSDGTTLHADGEVDLGFPYAGEAFYHKLK